MFAFVVCYTWISLHRKRKPTVEAAPVNVTNHEFEIFRRPLSSFTRSTSPKRPRTRVVDSALWSRHRPRVCLMRPWWLYFSERHFLYVQAESERLLVYFCSNGSASCLKGGLLSNCLFGCFLEGIRPVQFPVAPKGQRQATEHQPVGSRANDHLKRPFWLCPNLSKRWRLAALVGCVHSFSYYPCI